MLVDSHCHISLTTEVEREQLRGFYAQSSIDRVCLMSTNHLDFETVDKLASDKVVPCFGIHPWFAHLFTFDTSVEKSEHYKRVFNVQQIDEEMCARLPQPIDIHKHWEHLAQIIEKHKIVVLGEVGLDKLFRIPETGYYIGREAKMSKYRTHIDHQKAVLEFQLKAALSNNWPVSLHCVKGMGALIEIIKKLLAQHEYCHTKTNFMLHSYTGSVDSVKLLGSIAGKDHLFVSVSWLLNGFDGRYKDAVEVVGPDHTLIESDINVNNYTEQLELLRRVDSLLGLDNAKNLNAFLAV